MSSGIASEICEHPSRWALAVLFLAMLCSGLLPDVDLTPSGWFYVPGAGFSWSTDGILEFVRRWIPDIVIGSFVFCVALWAAGLCLDRWSWNISTPQIVYLSLTLLIGPALIVESLLKPFWGRARPKDIMLFGGNAAYTPPWQIAHECERNCSFASGHAAVAFWVTAYAFLLPQRWRVAGMFAGLAFGAAVGLVRIAQGAHFLSDIVAAGFIVLTINIVLARLILERSSPAIQA